MYLFANMRADVILHYAMLCCGTGSDGYMQLIQLTTDGALLQTYETGSAGTASYASGVAVGLDTPSVYLVGQSTASINGQPAFGKAYKCL